MKNFGFGAENLMFADAENIWRGVWMLRNDGRKGWCRVARTQRGQCGGLIGWMALLWQKRRLIRQQDGEVGTRRDETRRDEDEDEW